MKTVKIIVLILFYFSCGKNDLAKDVHTNKTQKIQVKGNWKSEHKISYLWLKPEGPENHQAQWIVSNDVMLFTPYEEGSYSIAVSIENSMGEMLGKKIFNYNVTNKNNSTEPIVKKINYKKNKLNKKTVANSYSIQISSWNEFEDAEKNMHKLNKLGYKSYIDTKEQNKNTLYRVRIGKKLTYNEAKKIRNQLKKHDIKDVWIDKN